MFVTSILIIENKCLFLRSLQTSEFLFLKYFAKYLSLSRQLIDSYHMNYELYVWFKVNIILTKSKYLINFYILYSIQIK